MGTTSSVPASPKAPRPAFGEKSGSVVEQSLALAAAPDRTLAAVEYRPVGEPARIAIVLHGATGVPARYYAPFAKWLAAEHGAAVLSYDYRDFGASAAGPMRQATATMSDWGLHDQQAAMAAMASRHPDIPLRIIGHSLGAMWLAFHDGIERVDRVLAVASGPAYWLNHPISYMPKVIWFWWLGGPLATLLSGYTPGAVGLGPDLPAGVYWQWRRWCLSPSFAQRDLGTTLPQPEPERARFRLIATSLSDDPVITPAMVGRLGSFYTAAKIETVTLSPDEFGLTSFGHIGIFAKRNSSAWPRLVDSLTW